MRRQPLPKETVIKTLIMAALWTALAIALTIGSGCATTPNDCMVSATCAQARLISAGVDARIGLVEIDGEHHAVTVWRVPNNSRLWCYDGQGTFETFASSWDDTDAIAVSCRAALRRQFLPVKWDRWVTP